MLAENILQYNVPSVQHENNSVKDNQGQYAFHQQPDQTVDQQDTQDSSDYESINKKQKLNNAQESVVLQPSQLLAAIQAKKPKAGSNLIFLFNLTLFLFSARIRIKRFQIQIRL